MELPSSVGNVLLLHPTLPSLTLNTLPINCSSISLIINLPPRILLSLDDSLFLLNYTSTTSFEISPTLDTGLNLHNPLPLAPDSFSTLNAILHGPPSSILSYSTIASQPNLGFGFQISKIPPSHFPYPSPITPLTPSTLPQYPTIKIFHPNHKPTLKTSPSTLTFLQSLGNLTSTLNRPNLHPYLAKKYVQGKSGLEHDFVFMYCCTILLNDEEVLRNFNRLFYILCLADHVGFRTVAREYVEVWDVNDGGDVGRGFKGFCKGKGEFREVMGRFEGVEEEEEEEGEEGREEDVLFHYPVFRRNVKEGEDEMMAAARILEEGGEALDEVKDFLLEIGE
ncbi:hypothetical protein TrST_g13375 [Triparma strigata]|uniref:Uncharacterized protein n=1 Tax=Triparma strigata TaxID=1606541 RepID=A0A9W7C1E5_9STRA|nr:hypothetical protein TrST_g13375 [Triparma strigata]